MKDVRRQCRFVALLLEAAHQHRAGEHIVLSAGNKRRSLPVDAARELISQGVLSLKAGRYAPTGEAPSWLKRQRLALLKQERPPQSAESPQPIKSENDTIVRLSRKAKGEEAAFLAAHHVLVANKVSALFEKSQLRPSVTQNLSNLRRPGATSCSGICDLSDMSIDCRKRLEQLTTHLPKDCAGVVVDVCGFDKGLQQVEFERSWPRRSARLILRMGLDHAADFWRIGEQARGPG